MCGLSTLVASSKGIPYSTNILRAINLGGVTIFWDGTGRDSSFAPLNKFAMVYM